MTEEQYQKLHSELSTIKEILTYNIIHGKKQIEQINVLDSVGYKPIEIAGILRTTSNTIRVSLVKLRKAKKGNGSRRKNGTK